MNLFEQNPQEVELKDANGNVTGVAEQWAFTGKLTSISPEVKEMNNANKTKYRSVLVTADIGHGSQTYGGIIYEGSVESNKPETGSDYSCKFQRIGEGDPLLICSGLKPIVRVTADMFASLKSA